MVLYYVKVGIIAQKNVEIPVLLIEGWGGVSPIYFVSKNIGFISVIWLYLHTL